MEVSSGWRGSLGTVLSPLLVYLHFVCPLVYLHSVCCGVAV
jgi:hypothetical protein